MTRGRGNFVSRLRASGGALLGIAAVAALVSAFGVGAVAFLAEQGTAGIRAELAARTGADLALQASLAPTANAQLQDSEVRAAIAGSLGPSGVRFAVTRALSGDVRVEPQSDSVIVERGLATSIPDLADRADLDAGAFADRETEVAVQTEAARLLGLSTGDTVLLDGVKFTVSGTWSPKDALDPRWYGDSVVATGKTDQFGPFVITEAAWSRLETAPTVSWTVVPVDVRELTSTNLSAVIGGWSSIQTDWRGQVSDMQAFGVKRGLSQTLTEVDARLDGQRAVEPVIFALLAALALITLSELVGLLVSARARESFLYWSRGRSPARIALRAAVDVAVAAVVGAAVGCALVVAAAPALGSTGLGQSLMRAAAIPLAVVAGSVALAAVRSVRATRAATSTSRGGRASTRVKRVALPGVVLLAVIGAGISVWQLRLYGSPVTPTASGRGAVDPLAVAAPAAALVALVLLIAAALPLLAKAGERLIGRGGVPLSLAARSLALHSSRFTAALVVVALAVGGTAVAAAYASTWSTSYDATAQLRAGADLRVSSTAEGISTEAQTAVRAALGEGTVAPFDSQPLSLGSVSGTILAVSPDALAALAGTAGGLFDPEAAAEGIRVGPAGPTVPAGASELTLTLVTVGLDEAPAVSVHVVDPMGFASVVEFAPGVAGGKGEFDYRADLADAGPLTVLSVDVNFAQGSFTAASARARLLDISALVGGSATPLELGKHWLPGGPGIAGLPPTGDGTGHGLSVEADTSWARLVPSFDGGETDRVLVPVILSQHLASLLGVGVGDTISFTLQEGVGRVSATIGSVVPAIPGAETEAAVLMDLAVVQHFQLRAVEVPGEPRDLWVSTASPAEVRDAIRPLLPANARFEAADDPAARQVLGSPRIVFWAAAVCFILLALVAVGSSLRARARWGNNDVATLRALGLGVRDQLAIPVTEFSVVLALGLLWGALSGALVSVLTVSQIVRAAVPQRYLAIGTDVSWDAPGLGALLAGLVVVVALLLAALAATVSRLATTAKPGAQE